MKYLCLFSAFIISYSASYAQTHAEKKFIKFAIGKEHILYDEKVGSYWIKELKETVNQDTLYKSDAYKYEGYRYYKGKLPDSVFLILTSSEKAFINNELDKMNDISWKDNIVKKSLAVSKVRTEKYKKKHNGQSEYNLKDFNNRIYTFTKPVFIRNKTVCFFFTDIIVVWNAVGAV